MFRGFRYRLDPTPEQAELLTQTVGVCRLIYNAALEQRERYWRQYHAVTGKRISFASQCRELTTLRNEVEWVAAVQRVPQEQALRDLDDAFARFFRGEANYPTPRKRWVHDSFRFKGSETRVIRHNAKWSAVLVSKIGMVKFRDTRTLPGTIKTVTISLTGGHWYVSFACDIEHQAAQTANVTAKTISVTPPSQSCVNAGIGMISRCLPLMALTFQRGGRLRMCKRP